MRQPLRAADKTAVSAAQFMNCSVQCQSGELLQVAFVIVLEIQPHNVPNTRLMNHAYTGPGMRVQSKLVTFLAKQVYNVAGVGDWQCCHAHFKHSA
jgi:hypothetical protein